MMKLIIYVVLSVQPEVENVMGDQFFFFFYSFSTFNTIECILCIVNMWY